VDVDGPYVDLGESTIEGVRVYNSTGKNTFFSSALDRIRESEHKKQLRVHIR
jgi:hypothetical protein